MKSKSFDIMKVLFITLATSSLAFADLASVASPTGNAAADALSRISASSQFEGVSTAALDPGTDLEEDLVYYSALELPDSTDPGDPTGGAAGGAGGGGAGGGGGGFGFTNPGDNGVITGGGGNGSSVTGGTDTGPGAGHAPSPGAAILGLIGMGCVGGLRRRV